MDKPTLVNQVRRIKNLTLFAKSSRIPLRTLFRIRKNESANTATLLVLEADLRRLKPELTEEWEPTASFGRKAAK